MVCKTSYAARPTIRIGDRPGQRIRSPTALIVGKPGKIGNHGRQYRLGWQTQRRFHDSEKNLDLSYQVIGITGTDHGQTCLGRRPPGGTCREELRPLRQLGCHRRKQPPGTRRPTAMTGASLCPVGEDRRRDTQRRQMSQGVPLCGDLDETRLVKAVPRGHEQLVPGTAGQAHGGDRRSDTTTSPSQDRHRRRGIPIISLLTHDHPFQHIERMFEHWNE